MILLEAAQACLGDERIVSDHELTVFHQLGDQVTVHFRQRSSGETLESVTGDVLIAADGIHSVYGTIFIWTKVTRFGAVACSGGQRRKGRSSCLAARL